MKMVDKICGINPESAHQNSLQYKLQSYGAEFSVAGAAIAVGSIVAYKLGVQEAFNLVPVGFWVSIGGLALSAAADAEL